MNPTLAAFLVFFGLVAGVILTTIGIEINDPWPGALYLGIGLAVILASLIIMATNV